VQVSNAHCTVALYNLLDWHQGTVASAASLLNDLLHAAEPVDNGKVTPEYASLCPAVRHIARRGYGQACHVASSISGAASGRVYKMPELAS
jgi:hypothetical protein